MPLLTHLDRLWTRMGSGGTGGWGHRGVPAAGHVPTSLDEWAVAWGPGNLLAALLLSLSCWHCEHGSPSSWGHPGHSRKFRSIPGLSHEMPIPSPHHDSQTISRPCPQVKTTVWSGPTRFTETRPQQIPRGQNVSQQLLQQAEQTGIVLKPGTSAACWGLLLSSTTHHAPPVTQIKHGNHGLINTKVVYSHQMITLPSRQKGALMAYAQPVFSGWMTVIF